MLSWFKRKTQRAEEASFKTRVGNFWNWFEAQSQRLYQVVDSGQGETLGKEISPQVESLGLGPWLPFFDLGPGPGGIGHSLTVSGRGNLHRQLLTIYWASRAPHLEGWTFYPACQAAANPFARIQIEENIFDPNEFWIVPKINLENEQIDLDVQPPNGQSIAAQLPRHTLFLFLIKALGEYASHRWIGKTNFNPSNMGEAICLPEIRDYIARVKEQHGWQDFPPGEYTSLCTFKDPHNRFPRGDIITIETENPTLLFDYLNAEGNLEDPLKGTGADYIYVAFNRSIIPKGAEVEKCGEIQTAIDHAMHQAQSGRFISGGMGTDNAYFDLMIFDQTNSIQIIRKVLSTFNLPAGTSINYFAKEKVGWRILL